MSESHSTQSNTEETATNTKRVVDYDRLIAELETAKVYMAMEEADRPALKKFLDGKPHDYHRMINHTFRLKKMTKDQALKALDDSIAEFKEKKEKAQGRRQAEQDKAKAKEEKAKPKPVMVTTEVQTEEDTRFEEMESRVNIAEGQMEFHLDAYRAIRRNQHGIRSSERTAYFNATTALKDLVDLLKETEGLKEFLATKDVEIDWEAYEYDIPKETIRDLPALESQQQVEDDMRNQLKERRIRDKKVKPVLTAKKEEEK